MINVQTHKEWTYLREHLLSKDMSRLVWFIRKRLKKLKWERAREKEREREREQKYTVEEKITIKKIKLCPNKSVFFFGVQTPPLTISPPRIWLLLMGLCLWFKLLFICTVIKLSWVGVYYIMVYIMNSHCNYVRVCKGKWAEKGPSS